MTWKGDFLYIYIYIHVHTHTHTHTGVRGKIKSFKMVDFSKWHLSFF